MKEIMMPMIGKEYGLHEPLGHAHDTSNEKGANDSDDLPELGHDGDNEW